MRRSHNALLFTLFSVALVCIVFTGATLVTKDASAATFRTTHFMAEQVVRMWFEDQNGTGVYELASGLSHEERVSLWQIVENIPFVQEVKRYKRGQRNLHLYYSLRLVFQDLLVYNSN